MTADSKKNNQKESNNNKMAHPHHVVWRGLARALEDLPSPDFPEVAFWGRSNVGKSSWLNTMMCRKNIARKGSRPGTTQAIHCYTINHWLQLIDLPGYGYAAAPKKASSAWNMLSIRYLESRPTLRALVLLVDCRHPSEQLDIPVLQWLQTQDIPVRVVANKSDKLTQSVLSKRGEEMQEYLELKDPPLLASAKSGRGRAQLWQWMQQYVVD